MRAASIGFGNQENSEGLMKRFHAHVMVNDLESSVRFYSALFGTGPAVLKPDYAKWMLDDPPVNFAITAGAARAGLDHLGLQLESDEELEAITARLEAAGEAIEKQENSSCCYTIGNKGWISDPSGVLWETFHTFGESAVYGKDRGGRKKVTSSPDAECCASAPSSASACCSASSAETGESQRG
jgi:catechol 2,3-dioxygenase-like lactoylglutathione lyase family enzyme